MDARKLAVVAALALGALYVVPRVVPTYKAEYVQPGTFIECHYIGPLNYLRPDSLNPSKSVCSYNPDITIPAHWTWPFFDPAHLITEGAALAVSTFLLIAALRWAWRSFR